MPESSRNSPDGTEISLVDQTRDEFHLVVGDQPLVETWVDHLHRRKCARRSGEEVICKWLISTACIPRLAGLWSCLEIVEI